MKILQGLFGFMWIIGLIGNGILFMYVEWTYIRQSFFNMINPLIHLQVMITLLTMPLFWILLAMAISGYFGATALEKKIDKEKRTKSVKKGIGGWLLLFVIFITIINPLINSAILLFLFFLVPIGTYILDPYMFYPTIMGIGFTFFSIYAGVSLWRVKPNAVKTAKIFLITWLVMNVISVIEYYAVAPTLGIFDKSFFPDGIINIAISWIIPIVLFCYLTKSKRVKATYGKKVEGVESIGDKEQK